MKNLFLATLLVASASAHATDWNQYVTIKQGSLVCKNVTSLLEVKRKLNSSKTESDDPSLKSYIALSGCFLAQTNARVHAALVEFGPAEIDVAIRKGYIPIVWLGTNLDKEYGVTFTDNLSN